MSEFHDLVNEIKKIFPPERPEDWKRVDWLIRFWLEEKAEDFRRQNGGLYLTSFKDVLGLSPTEKGVRETSPGSGIFIGGFKMEEPIKGAEEPVRTWCSHMGISKKGNPYAQNMRGVAGKQKGWKFCPICGKEKPKDNDLVTELAEVLYKAANYGSFEKNLREKATAALSFMRENKERI